MEAVKTSAETQDGTGMEDSSLLTEALTALEGAV